MSEKTITNILTKVKEQYEEYPYPDRKPENEKKALIITYGSNIPLINQECFKGKCDFENFKVLIAGGGTGDAAIAWGEYLRNKKNSTVTYLDMSTKSMSIAKERAKVRKLENISWINDSLLNLPNMGLGKFDMIDCAGVLHHLKDPDEGLKALKSVLKEKGAIALMVYARYGRSSIYILQNLFKMLNANVPEQKQQLANARKILESTPSYNMFNIMKGLGVWSYDDTNTDAGIYDLFLHSQDRAYTILETHEWLERCNMRMMSEPGMGYEAKEYYPETYIKDQALLDLIHSYPLKIQKAIGEAMSTKIARQCLFCTHDTNLNTAAKLNDEDMVISKGYLQIADLKELASILLQRRETFTVTYENHPSKPKIEVPNGKYVASLLNNIDGNRTVKEVIEAIKSSPVYSDKKVDEKLLMEDLDLLLKSMKRANVLFLRHKSVPEYDNPKDMQQRLLDMYKK